jgi:hypothetical protein
MRGQAAWHSRIMLDFGKLGGRPRQQLRNSFGLMALRTLCARSGHASRITFNPILDNNYKYFSRLDFVPATGWIMLSANI